jgi:hypothetical protein
MIDYLLSFRMSRNLPFSPKPRDKTPGSGFPALPKTLGIGVTDPVFATTRMTADDRGRTERPKSGKKTSKEKNRGRPEFREDKKTIVTNSHFI